MVKIVDNFLSEELYQNCYDSAAKIYGAGDNVFFLMQIGRMKL